MHNADVRILGTGIVSRVAALSLARQRLQVSLQARPAASAPMADLRAYALNPAAVAMLQSLRVWSALPEDAHTLVADMAIQGDDASHLDFSAWGQSVTALAWIVDAQALADALESAVAFAPDVHLAAEPAAAPLTVVAEGKTSATRLRPCGAGSAAGGRPAARRRGPPVVSQSGHRGAAAVRPAGRQAQLRTGVVDAGRAGRSDGRAR